MCGIHENSGMVSNIIFFAKISKEHLKHHSKKNNSVSSLFSSHLRIENSQSKNETWAWHFSFILDG